MKFNMKKAVALPALAVSLVAATGSIANANASGSSARSGGPDYTYGSPNPFVDATASVHVVYTGNGGTIVTLHVKGVDGPGNQTFGAHVHQRACGPVGTHAGGHYLHAGASGSLEEQEVWLDFTTNAAGNGHAKATRAWSLDQSTPRSVVIHAMATAPDGTAGARLACIDLNGQS